jgi:hypothetical protein
MKSGAGPCGYNVTTGECGDMLEEGILRPAQVTRRGAGSHQPELPAPPLKGPTSSGVIHPP